MENIFGTVGPLLIFALIIVVHELGHFVAAKWSKMTVHEFSVGFGPRLVGWTRNGTAYNLRIIPLGGFVRIGGMELGEEEEANGFYTKPFAAKFLTLIAGVAMNFVLALVIFIVVGMSFGYPVFSKTPIIGKVHQETPASQAGLRAGDRIVAIDGQTVTEWEDATEIIHAHPALPMQLTYARHEAVRTIMITPQETDLPDLQGLRLRIEKVRVIGIEPASTLERLGPVESVVEGGLQVARRTQIVVASLVSMILGDIPANQVGGMVQIIRISHDASKDAVQSSKAFVEYLGFIAFLSVNIGIMNLLPIPALDGGHLFFLTAEAVSRRKFDRAKLAMINAIGMILLLSLVVLLIIKDTVNWVGGR